MKLDQLHDISLKWKLLIPFLFLASMGALALFIVSYRSQAQLIHIEEEKRLTSEYHYFLDIIESKKNQMMSLATFISLDMTVVEAFARRDRERLFAHLAPAFEELSRSHDVRQIHFHVPPAMSFLRVHLPKRYGDDLSPYRETINVVRESGKGVCGLEKGVTGFSVRGVVPVFFGQKQIGTVEVGSSFGKPFLTASSRKIEADIAIYMPGENPGAPPQLFSATGEPISLSRDLFEDIVATEKPIFQTGKAGDQQVAYIVGPVTDFSGKTVAVSIIAVDREETLSLLATYRNTAVSVGLIGLVLSISFVWFISVVFTNRIAKVVQASDQIASGQRDARIEVKEADEIGVMANAINEMLGSLEASRNRVKDYADNLEQMVEQRTKALQESEETYRALVEHVPLIVYFVMPDSTAVYMNKYVQQVIGIPVEKLGSRHGSWARYIDPGDRQWVLDEFNACLQQGKRFECEYRMVHKDGHTVHVLDLAVPVFDESGRVLRMDGIILDVTASKELQEKIVQAEELVTLSEVSARLAHEIRNPVTSIGGLTRRLVRSFDPSDTRKRKGELIVEEVSRLERILAMMISYIEPKAIQLMPHDLNTVVTRAVAVAKDECGGDNFSIEANLAEDLGSLNLDGTLFQNVLVSLMKNAYFRMGGQGKISISTRENSGHVNLTIAYHLPFVADDDIDHFFYPFVVDYPFRNGEQSQNIMDVPICRVLIHKHGGIIHVNKEGENKVVITITLDQE